MSSKMRMVMTFVIVLFLTGLFPGIGSVGESLLWGAVLQVERDALIALYNNTDGDNWTNNAGWKTPPLHTDGFALPGTENTWYGITCDAGNTTVTGIDLASNNLSGTIPPELGNLYSLVSLFLHENYLTGSIPAGLCNLPMLKYLWLCDNQLSGNIPSGVGYMGSFVELTLANNQLTGSIPSSFSNMNRLCLLHLNSNQLTGAIPSELGNMSALAWLDLSSNQLTGSIPPGFSNLLNLDKLVLSNNRLSGSIPAGLGNLPLLTWFIISNNQLTGTIPVQLGNLVNVQRIILSYNQLTGSIPPALANPEFLDQLDLSHNLITGSIPAELGTMDNVSWLDLSFNQLTGSIPAELGNLASLQKLYINSNILSGAIPVTITNLLALLECDLRWNALYTNIDAVRTFLNLRQIGENWENTQTIAPTGLSASPLAYSPIELNWTPIVYTGDQGGYRVFYSKTSGGPYTYFGQTLTKSISIEEVDGLEPLTTYYFVLQTRTLPHVNNLNIVNSEYSSEVSATTVNFFTISGKVATGAGVGVPGVTLVFSPSGGSAVTDSSGLYSHSVGVGWSGTVTPSLPGYTFSPLQINFTNVLADQPNQNFVAIPPPNPIISGRVVTAQGYAVPGVTLVFSAGAGSVVTGSSGQYTHQVTRGWSGTVTPSLPGFSFSPPQINFTNVLTDQPNQNFVATSYQNPIISGIVFTADGSPLPGVQLFFSGTGGFVYSDYSGFYYEIVSFGWSGTVTPSLAGYIFSPPQINFTNVVTDQPNQNFVAIPFQSFIISGRVVTAEGNGLPGVTLVFSPSGDTTTTGADGYYQHNVRPGWSGTLVPSLTGYTFSPASIEFKNVNSHQADQNFKAIPVQFYITGKVTTGGDGIAGVTMNFAAVSGQVETVTTNDQGFYNHQIPYGWKGKVTPSQGNFLFSPPSREYPDSITTNQENQDYTLCISVALDVSRDTDSTVLISKEFGRIKVNVNIIDIPPSTVQKLIILRREGTGDYLEVFSYSPQVPQAQSHSYSFTYEDKYLAKDRSYTYFVRAVDASGKIISESKTRII